MSKLRQPIFEKPAEPDFIRQLRYGQEQEAEARTERPMTEAPAREEDMPAIVNEVDASDIEKLREMHGLQSTPTDDAQKHMTDRPTKRNDQIAGIGSKASDIRKRKKLEQLKTRRLDDHKLDSAEGDDHSKSLIRTRTADKKVKRKKIKIDLDLDEIND